MLVHKKRIISILLTLVMVFSMTVTANAAESYIPLNYAADDNAVEQALPELMEMAVEENNIIGEKMELASGDDSINVDIYAIDTTNITQSARSIGEYSTTYIADLTPYASSLNLKDEYVDSSRSIHFYKTIYYQKGSNPTTWKITRVTGSATTNPTTIQLINQTLNCENSSIYSGHTTSQHKDFSLSGKSFDKSLTSYFTQASYDNGVSYIAVGANWNGQAKTAGGSTWSFNFPTSLVSRM